MRSSVAEAVADAADSEDVLRVARVGLDLLAQVADVDVDRARLAIGGVAPERPEQHLPREDTRGLARQRPQKLELDVGQLNRLARQVDRSPGRTDSQLAR